MLCIKCNTEACVKIEFKQYVSFVPTIYLCVRHKKLSKLSPKDLDKLLN